MYCSGCGAAVTADLNYCKQCGKRVASEESSSVAQSLAESLGYIGGFGLAGLMLGAFLLTKAGVESWALVWIALFYLTALVAICSLVLWQSSRLTSGRHLGSAPQPTFRPELSQGVSTSQLPPASSQPASVVDHTTRTLDKVER